MNQKFRAIFFDLDDTLYDGSIPWLYSLDKMIECLSKRYSGVDFHDFQEVLQKVRNSVKLISPNSYVMTVRSISFRDLLRYYGIDFTWDEILELEEIYWDFFLEGIKPIKGLREMIDMLSKNYDLYIITDSGLSDQIKRLCRLKLHMYFIDILTAQEIEQKKTGKIYKIALDRYNLYPNEVLMIGDKVVSDIRPANKLGINTVLVPNTVFPTTSEEKKEADYCLESILDLNTIL